MADEFQTCYKSEPLTLLSSSGTAKYKLIRLLCNTILPRFLQGLPLAPNWLPVVSTPLLDTGAQLAARSCRGLRRVADVVDLQHDQRAGKWQLTGANAKNPQPFPSRRVNRDGRRLTRICSTKSQRDA